MLKWIVPDTQYMDYLRDNVDSRIPRTNYGDEHMKPLFGVLFYEKGFAYVAHVSHPQDRHRNMKSTLDFIKVFHGDKLICVINLNYMFPIPTDKVVELGYSDVGLYRSFASDTDKQKYIALLKLEMKQMHSLRLSEKARRVYTLVSSGLNAKLNKRCFNFRELEVACVQYYSTHNQ